MNLKFLCTSFCALFLAPISVSHFTFVNVKHGLKIVAPKADPPRIAFDDLRWQKPSELTEIRTTKTTEIVNLNTIYESKGSSPSLFLNTKRVSVEGFTISRQTILAMLEKDSQIQQVEQNRQEWIQSLSPAQKSRAIAAQEKYKTLDDDWQIPSIEDDIKRRVAEATEANAEVESKEKNSIYIAAQTPEGWKTRDQVEKASIEVKENPERKSHSLSGTWQLNGLPLGPEFHYEVRRFEDGIAKEQGRVEYNPNRWTITVENLEGYVAIQAFDNKGNILGEGRRRLGSTPFDKQVLVTKVDDRTAGNVIAYNDVRTPQMMSQNTLGQKCVSAKVLLASYQTEVVTDNNCQFEFPNVRHDSWSLVRIEDAKHAPTLNLMASGEQKNWPLLRKSMVAALKSLVRDQRKASEFPETGSVIWGQILQDGKPLAGIQVEAELFPNQKAVYFNEILVPDSSLRGTSSNGYFAILDLPEGFHALRASVRNEYVSHINVVTEDNTVSLATMESSLRLEPVVVKVFDAFSGAPQRAKIELQSLKNELSVTGLTQVFLPVLKRHSLMRVTPESQEYVESVQTYNEEDDFIHAILIRSHWLQDLRSRSLISEMPSGSTTIGFVDNTAFDIYLTHDENYASQNIVYFDAQGERTSSGTPGGGFVLFNVPEGVQSVVIISKDTGKVYSQVLPSDSGAVSVFKARF